MKENPKFTEAINSEIAKGRTFEQILNETPNENCDITELNAWLDAFNIGSTITKKNNSKTTYRKMKTLEVLLIVLISVMFISPFIVPNNLFLLLNIPLGILVGIIGRTNTRLYNKIKMRIELNELTKHLTVKGYTKRALIKEFIVKLLFTPFQLVCLACEIVFPPFK